LIRSVESHAGTVCPSNPRVAAEDKPEMQKIGVVECNERQKGAKGMDRWNGHERGPPRETAR